MSNPIPRNIYQRIVEKLREAAEFSVTLKGKEGKITEATWDERQEAEVQTE